VSREPSAGIDTLARLWLAIGVASSKKTSTGRAVLVVRSHPMQPPAWLRRIDFCLNLCDALHPYGLLVGQLVASCRKLFDDAGEMFDGL
jgi:hypothetical protein